MGRLEEEARTQITGLLKAWRAGDDAALERLTPLVYAELKKIARGYARSERPDATLQATALVNEAYLRLAQAGVEYADRAHFFAVSAQVMRRILVDAARARHRGKRGGHAARVQLDEVPDIAGSRGRELIAVDDALTALAAFDPRKARVIELRFFGGLSVEETADVLKVSPQTVMRDWSLARSWVKRELKQTGG
ncbi:MAG TPA: RNA polymerase subunit sigma-70 [Solibacterales bacterium]|nr:RNA polymerase subunit sigma-70 [Bryobacterales bacterium]